MGLFGPPQPWFTTPYLVVLQTGSHCVHVRRVGSTGLVVVIMRKVASFSGKGPWSVALWNPVETSWANSSVCEKFFNGDNAGEDARSYIETIIGGTVAPLPKRYVQPA